MVAQQSLILLCTRRYTLACRWIPDASFKQWQFACVQDIDTEGWNLLNSVRTSAPPTYRNKLLPSGYLDVVVPYFVFTILFFEYYFNFWTLLVNYILRGRTGLSLFISMSTGQSLWEQNSTQSSLSETEQMDRAWSIVLGHQQRPSRWLPTAAEGGGFQNHHSLTDTFLLIITTLEIKKLRFGEEGNDFSCWVTKEYVCTR